MNGAVECNGSQYNFSDFDSNLQALFDEGKLPYLPIGKFDEMVTNQGGCDSFGYGVSNSSVVEIYAWGASYSISPYPETVYTTTDNPVEEDIVYELSNGVITKLGTVAIKQSSTTIRIRFENDTEIAGWNRQTGSDTTAELVQPFSPTTYFKVPKKLSRVLVRTQKPTTDNDYTWYNVYADGWVEQGGNKVGIASSGGVTIELPISMSDNHYSNQTSISYSEDSPSVLASRINSTKTTATTFNVITTFANSTAADYGIYSFKWRLAGYAAPSEYTKDKWNYQNVQVERPMIQLFNSTTDTAVATCNQVLADISTLNQGDYVVYWDSYELSDHSHAYTGITLDEYQWYRIYKSGWVEQGGFNRTNGSNATRITIPVEMKSVNYTPAIQGRTEENGYINAQWQVMPVNNTTSSTTTTSFVAQGSITGYNLGFRWQVSGFSFLA